MTGVQRALRKVATPKKAASSRWFFKTGKGEYGERDTFLGVTVPEQRAIAKKFRNIPTSQVFQLLESAFHEERLTALFILVDQFGRADDAGRADIFHSYLKHAKYVNNWDLVDSSAPHIVGTYLLHRPRTVLAKLVRSNNIWKRRIGILATQTFIRNGETTTTFVLAEVLLGDTHDLIHKAVGWMLREAGEKDEKALLSFIAKHRKRMPRTMLRYAIEKLSKTRRYAILHS